MVSRTLVWFRRDLRIYDHEPLHRAALRGVVIPVFIFDRSLLRHPETGAARVAFMVDCLRHLDQDLRRLGGRLILRHGDPTEVLPQLIEATQADGIYSYTDCERIYGRVRDARLNQVLADRQMKIRWFEPVASSPELMAYPRYRQRWYQEVSAPVVPVPAREEVPADLESDALPALVPLGHRTAGKTIPPGSTRAARQLL